MMRTIFKVLLITCVTSIASVSAQNSAQVQDFVDLGSRPVSGYTGRVEKEIPICSINEFGFSINVGLHYSSTGFRPSMKESEVGHNWFLNAGGAITRTVHGVEDELRDDRQATDVLPNSNEFRLDGYYTGIKKHTPTEQQVIDRTMVNESDENYYVGPIDDAYEVTPDEFRFNFGGVSGSFYIDLDGSVKVIPNGPYHLKVDISNFATQRAESGIFDARKPVDSQIVITLDNGYKYYFGGNHNYLQWYWNSVSVGAADGALNNVYRPLNERPIISTWNLAKIVAPNGYEVVYEYNPYDFEYRYYDIGQDQPQKKDESIVVGQQRDGIPNGFRIPGYNHTACAIVQSGFRMDILKKSNIKAIKINNTIHVNFQYSNIVNPLTDRPGHILDKVLVSGIGIPSKEVDLDYVFYNQRPFLKSVTTNNEEPYVFEYQYTDDLPGYDTDLIDKNGYYHIGKYSKLNRFGYGYRYNEEYGLNTTPSGGPLPGPESLNKICYYCYDVNNQVVTCNHPGNQNLAYKGLLKNITLPTKGSIRFFYNTNDYKPWVSGAEPIRVSKVEFDDGNANISTKQYAENDNEASYAFDLYHFLSVDRKKDLVGVNIAKEYKITEEKLSNGALLYSVYRDIRQNGISSGNGTFNQASIPITSIQYNPPAFNVGEGSGVVRGKLIAQFSFDSEGKPLSKTEYFYTVESDKENNVYSNRIPAIATIEDWGSSYNIYLKPVFLKSKKTYSYDQNTVKRYGSADVAIISDTTDVKLQGVEEYIYDSNYHKIKERISYNDHQKQKTTYTYPYEYSTADPVINKMVTDNILPQISQKSTLENKGTSYALGTSVSEFKIHNNIVVPSKSYQWSPAPNAESLTLAGSQLGVGVTGQVQISDPDQTVITTYDQYSNQGVPYEISNNRNTSGYTFYTQQDRKPFLAISNITHAALTAIPASGGAASNVVEALQQINTDQQQIEEVSYLIDYLAEHYPFARCAYTNYDVNTGLVKFTMDSRKQKNFFEYDDRHRLTITKDNEGNIINHTLYNTKK
ncbi:hypothetical protein [Aquimarina sp. AU119]|uniref:hypothetical protein n=1 Tax=Aquimarina sp. AU119 TaxID=2108528 RepID=UPI001359F3BF|nr:hypothetical protein [Aquimarina sp. AU119]